MQEIDLPLLIHGESIDPQVDIFDREQRFIDQELTPLLKRFPALRIVLEHISTQQAVNFVQEGPAQLAATITAHHFWYNRNALFTGGIRPHYYCMPILKRRSDQEALFKAASVAILNFSWVPTAPHMLNPVKNRLAAAREFTRLMQPLSCTPDFCRASGAGPAGEICECFWCGILPAANQSQ